MLIVPGSTQFSISLLSTCGIAAQLGKSLDGKHLIRPASLTVPTKYAKSVSYMAAEFAEQQTARFGGRSFLE
jgi:hypothetical protein